MQEVKLGNGENVLYFNKTVLLKRCIKLHVTSVYPYAGQWPTVW